LLKEELSVFTSKQRKYLLYLVAGVKREKAYVFADVLKNTVKSWLQTNQKFHDLVDRMEELRVEFFEEALHMLRHENRLLGLFLEQELITQLRREIQDGELVLAKTPLAKEVYNKVMEGDKGGGAVAGGWLKFVQQQVVNTTAKPNELAVGEVKELPPGRD